MPRYREIAVLYTKYSSNVYQMKQFLGEMI
jgi:hypothetical protein